MRGDGSFDRYCASLTSLRFSTEERQTLAQNALKSLLQITKKAILIGEGTGATASWLAADLEPAFVAGVVAVEPPGPPFCDATIERQGKRKFDSFTSFNPNRLKYGLSTIPLTYSPAVRPESLPSGETAWHPLDLALFVHTDTGKTMVLQCSPDDMPLGFHFLQQITHQDGEMHVRKLTNLSKMRHVIFTGEASSHSAYDGSTLHFMQQAGLTVDCGFLERYNTTGNGHLMFLETNSDEIAAHIVRWIQNKAGQVDGAALAAESELYMPSMTVPPAAVINMDEYQQFFESPKKVRRSAPQASQPLLASTSQARLVDFTDDAQLPNHDCANKAVHAASGAEYLLSSTSITPTFGEMPPPPLPTWINAAKARGGGPAAPMTSHVKLSEHEPSPSDSEYFTSLGNFDQGYVSVSSSMPKQAPADSQQLVSKRRGMGPGSRESERAQPSQDKIKESLAYSAAQSYRKDMVKHPSPPAAKAIPRQAGLNQNGIRISESHGSKGPQPRDDIFHTPPEYPNHDLLQDLFSEFVLPTPAHIKTEETGFKRNEIGVDGSQESAWPSRAAASSDEFSAYPNLEFFQEPLPELSPPTVQSSPRETRFKRNKVDVDGRQETNWPRNGYASFDTVSEYSPRCSPPLSLPLATAVKATFPQPQLEHDEISNVVGQKSKKPQAGHDNFYTDYRFDFSAPQSMGQDGNQDRRPCAPSGDDAFQASSQHAAPVLQKPSPFRPTSTADQGSWQDGAYIWPMQSGGVSSSFSQVPRCLPDLQPGEAAVNVADLYRERTGAGRDSSLDGMPHDLDLDPLLQNDDDDELQGYAY